MSGMRRPSTTRRATRSGIDRETRTGSRKRTCQGWRLGGGPDLAAKAELTYKLLEEVHGRLKAREYEQFQKAVEKQEPFCGLFFAYAPFDMTLPKIVRARTGCKRRKDKKGGVYEPTLRDLVMPGLEGEGA